MFVEVAYDYQPIVPVTNYFGVLPAGMFTAKQIRVTQAFNVRQRNPANDKDSLGLPLASPPSDITNTTALTSAQKSSCATFSA